MKAFLIVLLFSIATCEFSLNFGEIAKCIFESKKLKEYLPKLIKKLKEKDFENLLSLGLIAFQEVKEEIKCCIDSEEPILKGCRDMEGFTQCFIDCNKTFLCFDHCLTHYCP